MGGRVPDETTVARVPGSSAMYLFWKLILAVCAANTLTLAVFWLVLRHMVNNDGAQWHPVLTAGALAAGISGAAGWTALTWGGISLAVLVIGRVRRKNDLRAPGSNSHRIADGSDDVRG